MAAWDIQPGEPTQWFARFERFRLAGAGRSLLAAYKAERGRAGSGGTPRRVPGAWDRAATAWRWRERAEAWDAAVLAEERERREADLAEERERAREDRRTLLKVIRTRAAQALAALEPRAMKPGEALRAAQLFLEESRAEYDDEPTRRVREEPLPPIDWSLVPDEMQVAFLDRQLSLAQVLAYVAQHKQPAGD